MSKQLNRVEKLIFEFCPSGVKCKTLGELGEFYGGLSGKSKDDFSNGNAKYVTYMNIVSNIAINININTFVKIREDETQNKVEYGDTLFTGSSETPDEVGMSSVMTKKIDEPLYLNSFCFGFRLNDKNIFLPEFLKYLFRDKEIRKQIIKTGSGVTRFNISKKRFAKIIIPIPPICVQEEIVRILNNFTELEAELEAELETRKKQYSHYTHKLLHSNLNMKSIGEVCDVGDGNHSSNYPKSSEMVETGVPFIRGTNLVNGTISPKDMKFITAEKHNVLKKGHLKEGDVLFMNRGDIGKTAYIPKQYENANLNSQIAWLRAKRNVLTPKYLFFILNTSFIQNGISHEGGALKQLTIKKLKAIKIPTPSLQEQERIASILDRFNTLVNDITIGLPAELNARRQQYEYYRNKLLTFKE